MIVVKEQKRENETYYNIETYNYENELIYKEPIYLKSSKIEKKGNLSRFILYDGNMKPIREAFRFLNYGLNNLATNTKEKSLYALKLLYIFQKIANKNFKIFDKTDICNLVNFLRGYSPQGEVISFELTTIRNWETINGYLSVYRNYMRFLNIGESSFLTKSEKQIKVLISENEADMIVTPYDSSEKAPSVNEEVPMYISVEEFKDILHIVRKEYSKREECIIRIMYQCGLRIGEVLGLTGDDVVIEKVKNQYVAIAYLRNRVSDKRDQRAKTCMKVTNVKQYKTKAYNTRKHGFQTVIIPMDLYDLINEYIEEAHVFAREKKHDKYYKHSIADRVRKADEFEDDNYYIFLNSQGKPLLSHTWNYTLRRIFKKANIQVDTDNRKNNLNHRFRHGYAMYEVQYKNTKILELKEKLRHRCLTSVLCYYRPTIVDKIKLKNEFTNDLYTIIPELDLSKQKGK